MCIRDRIKAQRVIPDFELLSDEEIKAAKLPKGSIGPKNLPEGIKAVSYTHLL